MSLVTFESGSLTWNIYWIKILDTMLVFKLAKPIDYSKKEKKINLTHLQNDKALYLFNKLITLG